MALPLLPAASRQRNVSDSGGDAASLPSPLLSPPLSCLAPVPGLPRCRCRLARPFPSGQARPSQAGVDAAATGRSPAALRRPEGWRGRNKMPFGCPLESCSPQKLPAESAPGWRSKCRCRGEACPPPPSAPSFTWQVESKVLLGVQTSSAFTLGVGILCS